jgi:hypothetical protein
MFDEVVVGIQGFEAGRDAIALAESAAVGPREVDACLHGGPQSEPAPEADRRPDDETQRFGLERLARLRDEGHVAGEIARIPT